MKRSIFLMLIVFAARIYGQSSPDMLSERVYLQTDKQLYLAGELVYMKVLTVTPEKKPLSFSKIAYVELLDKANSRVQIKIDLSNGVGDGWMELPITLPTGHYRLVAYTRYMRNEGESVFFEKNIGVVNTFQSNQIRKEYSDDAPTAPEIYNRPASSLHTDKTLYANREKWILKLEGLPENIHTLSVSIAGKASVAVEGTNDIRQWEKQIPISSIQSAKKYLPEYEGHIITGKLISVQIRTNTDDEILIPLLSFPGEKLYLFRGRMDNSDNVSFYATNTAGIKEVSTTAYNLSENMYRIDLQSPFVEQHIERELPDLKVDSSHFGDLLQRSFALQALYSYTKDNLTQTRTSDFRIDIKPLKTYILDEWTRFPVMSELMTEFISELRFRRDDRKNNELYMASKKGDIVTYVKPLVVLDGIPIMDHEILYAYNPLSVERINIYTGEYYFQGIRFEGIAEFLTYGRNYPGLSTNQSTQIVNYSGTQIQRRLYTPDYSSEENRRSRLPDNRHTLLWEPALPTKGKSTLEVPFYTSDYCGDFQATVEGLTKDGEIISYSTSFEVRKKQ